MAWEATQQDYFRIPVQRRFPLITKRPPPQWPLAVRVAVKFQGPLNVDYHRRYESSPGFVASEAVCQGLLRRLDHCCQELLTRKDPAALDEYDYRDGSSKALRYEICVQLEWDGKATWAERSYKSFQRQVLTMEAAKDLILATDRMVGPYLRRHDPAFKWTEGPVRERSPLHPRTAQPGFGSPQSLCCVPRAKFLSPAQQYEFVPGYEVEVALQSRCAGRQPSFVSRSVKVSSSQSTPLNLAVGEELLWKLSSALDQSFRRSKERFDEAHSACNALEGTGGCTHTQTNATDIRLRIKNNLGPEYDHLNHHLQSRYTIFFSPQGQDCLEFLRDMHKSLNQATDEADAQLDQTNDFTLRVHELAGPNWALERGFTFSLDNSLTYSRRSVEAILERVQTGVADVLRGNDVTITLVAHKRGHLIMDKTLVSRKTPESEGIPILEPELDAFADRIRDRIQQDILMVCRDTCSPSDDEDSGFPLLAFYVDEPLVLEASEESELGVSDVSQVYEPSQPSIDGKTSSIVIVPMPATRSAPPDSIYDNNEGGPEEDVEAASMPPSTPSLVGEDLATPLDSAVASPVTSRIPSTAFTVLELGLNVVDSSHQDMAAAEPESPIISVSKAALVGVATTALSTAMPESSVRAVQEERGLEEESERSQKPEGIMEGWLEYYCEPCSQESAEASGDVASVTEEEPSALQMEAPVLKETTEEAALPVSQVEAAASEELAAESHAAIKAEPRGLPTTELAQDEPSEDAADEEKIPDQATVVDVAATVDEPAVVSQVDALVKDDDADYVDMDEAASVATEADMVEEAAVVDPVATTEEATVVDTTGAYVETVSDGADVVQDVAVATEAVFVEVATVDSSDMRHDAPEESEAEPELPNPTSLIESIVERNSPIMEEPNSSILPEDADQSLLYEEALASSDIASDSSSSHFTIPDEEDEAGDLEVQAESSKAPPERDSASLPESLPEQDGTALPESLPEQDGTALPESLPEQDGMAVPESLPEQDGMAVPEPLPEQDGTVLPEPQPEQDDTAHPEPQPEHDDTAHPEPLPKQDGTALPEPPLEQAGTSSSEAEELTNISAVDFPILVPASEVIEAKTPAPETATSETTVPATTTPLPPVDLWSQSRPVYQPEDEEERHDAAAAASQPGPSTTQPAGQTDNGSAASGPSAPKDEPAATTALASLRANPPVARPRPVSMHKRQFSSPTAGLLGLHDEQFQRVNLRSALVGHDGRRRLEEPAPKRWSSFFGSLSGLRAEMPMGAGTPSKQDDARSVRSVASREREGQNVVPGFPSKVMVTAGMTVPTHLLR